MNQAAAALREKRESESHRISIVLANSFSMRAIAKRIC
jgi:hypothetical protein